MTGIRGKTWFAIAGTAIAAACVYALVCRHSGASTAENTAPSEPRSDRSNPAIPRADRVTAASIEYDDDPRGDQRLEGQVIDDNEQPVAGASVVLDAHPPLEAITEADGTFAFEHLTARIYRVEARTGDRVAGPVAVRLTATSAPVVLRLRRATRVIVDVRSRRDDRPIAGALVEVRALAIASALTDDHGRATLRGVRGGWHVLHVTAAGYASTSTELAIAEIASGEISTVVHLSEGVAVEGTVVGVDGTPIEGARVVAEQVSRWSDGSDVSLDGVLSDAKGRWRLGGLPRESLRLIARRSGYAPGATPPIPLADGERTGIVITLERGARLTGRTVDANGAAVPGAEVRVVAGNNAIRRAACDRDGRFAIDGVPRMRAHVAAFGDAGSSPIALVDLQHGDKDITLTLSATSSITGVVVTSKGEPVAEARVVAVPRANDDRLARVDARLRGQLGAIADDDGAFKLTGLVPGAYHLRAIRPGAPSALLEMKQGVLVETGSTDARVVVDDLGQIRGTLAFADGGAPTRVSARLGVEPPRWFDGASFTITNVPAGKNFLKLDGPELVAATVSDVEVPAGGTADLGTIRVVRGREISGRVVDAHGQPIAAASIVLARKLESDGNTLAPSVDTQPDIVLSGGDGRFAIRGVGPASQVVVADHQDVGRSESVAIPAGTANLEIELVLQAPGAVQGFVRADNEPAAEAVVLLRPRTSGNSDFLVTTGPDGSYRFDRIAPGNYILYGMLGRGTQTGGSDGNGRGVTVEAGRVLDADLDLTREGVTVTLAIGTPASVEYGYGILGHSPTEVPIPHTISEARALAANVDQLEVREGMIVENRRIKLSPIRLGRQLACITPLRGNPSDPAVLAELQNSQLDQPIYCKYVTITTEGQVVVIDTAPLPPAK